MIYAGYEFGIATDEDGEECIVFDQHETDDNEIVYGVVDSDILEKLNVGDSYTVTYNEPILKDVTELVFKVVAIKEVGQRTLDVFKKLNVDGKYRFNRNVIPKKNERSLLVICVTDNVTKGKQTVYNQKL